MVAADVRAARERVLEQVRSPLPGPWFAEGVMGAVGGAIGFDGYCLFGVDPISGIRSVMFSRHGLVCATDRLIHNETVEHDLHRYQDLVRGPRRAAAMSVGGSSEPRSPRLHEILRPQGYTSELRQVLVTGGHYWGALSLFRDDHRHPFTDADVAAASELAEPLSLAVRRYQTGRPCAERDSRRPGVVLVDTRGVMTEVSPEAHLWLSGLAESWTFGTTVDDVSRVVLEVARATREGRVPQCRVRMPGGEWMVVSGTTVGSSVAVVLQAGDLGSVVPAFSVWCGLTRRESRVLGLVASGLAAKQVAHRVDVSVLTVNDHLKSIYRKAHVHGREELVSLL